MRSGIYTTVDDDGNAENRRFIADRLAEFNEKFPLKEGWSVEITTQPTEYVIPATKHAPMQVQKAAVAVATLTNPQGRVVRRAESFTAAHGTTWKALESNSTNALARLMELCGIHGRLTLEDELAEQRSGQRVVPASAQGSAATTTAPPTSMPPAAPIVETRPAPESATSVAATSGPPIAPVATAIAADPTQSAQSSRPPRKPPARAQATASSSGRADPDGPPRPVTLQALKTAARQLGEQPPPTPATEREALLALSVLQERRKQQHNGATTH